MSSTSALTSEQRSDAGSKALGAESLAAFIATADRYCRSALFLGDLLVRQSDTRRR